MTDAERDAQYEIVFDGVVDHSPDAKPKPRTVVVNRMRRRALFGATPAEQQAAIAWLASYGLSV